jgi:iron-sulfur cluster repair protein YtfE (RIC family)
LPDRNDGWRIDALGWSATSCRIQAGGFFQAMTQHPLSSHPSCTCEWASRSLTELIAHLTDRYRSATAQHFEEIEAMLLAEPSWTTGASQAAFDHLLDVLRRLDEMVHAHSLLEDHVMHPLVVAVEYPDVVSVCRSRSDIERLVSRITHEHVQISQLVDDLQRAALRTTAVLLAHPPKGTRVIRQIAALGMWLREQLTLEDRCLWPRALELFRKLP